MSDRYAPPPPDGPYGGSSGGQYGGSSPGGQYGGGSSGGQYGGPEYGGSSPGGQYGGGSSGGQYGGPEYGRSSPGDQYGAPPPPSHGGEAPPPPPAPRKSGAGRKVVGVLVAILVVLVVGALKFGLFSGIRSAFGGGDKAAAAKAGDCIASLPQVAEGQQKEAPDAKVVACNSAEAKYTVLGRIDNQTAAQAKADQVCRAYKEAEYVYSAIPNGGTGYVLCLKPAPAEAPATKK